MGFTDKNNNSINFIKIKGLEKSEKIHYWENNGEQLQVNNFSGKLIKVQAHEYEFEGKTRPTIKMLFVDSMAEYYQLDISYNSLSRNIINTLLGYVYTQKEPKGKINLDLSLYINKAGYKQIGIQINGERGNWKYSIEEQKGMIEIITNKKGEFVSSDYSIYDEKLKNGLIAISDFITITDFVEEIKTNIEDTTDYGVIDNPF